MKNLFITLFFFRVLCCQGQNVGIGTAAPSAPLHIKSATLAELLRVDGSNPYISFHDIGTYRGYLWYNSNRMELGTPLGSLEPVVIAPGRTATGYFTTNGRLGIGTATPSEKLDVAGNINLTGLLKVNGSSGITGQVLTSNGSSDPQWENMAYGNTIRFAFNFQQNADEDGYVDVTGTRYNMSPTNITIADPGVTLVQSGLYHFEILVNAQIFYLDAPTTDPYFTLIVYPGGGLNYNLTGDQQMRPTSATRIGWKHSQKLTFEVWLNGPIDLSFWHNFVSTAFSTSHSINGYVIGHLISQ